MGNLRYAEDYTLSEFLATASAREIKDNETIFAGVGIPTLGALLAKLTHAPNAIIAMESGSIGPQPYRIILGIGDNPCVENALMATSLWRLFSDQQRGFFDVGMVGGAQVDKYGNLNSTAIFGEGDYFKPAARLPGSGGANDIASSAGRTIITMPLQKRRFLERVDYITSPGYLEGYDSREQAGLLRGGPVAIITNKCIFRFDEETKEAYLDSLHPGVTVEEVKDEVSWDLKVADDLKTTELPTVEQVKLIRALDRNKIYTGNGLKNLTFENYIKMLEESYESFKELF
ncbi:MAG: glutaconate CoA-transferase, subunit [Candidatus Petromonas sp.]|jgi:glutaconate CoA-transferase subunit B|nr:glutaconate CoA-transferase, subunit [Candidatus Petromonas sp.]